MQFYLDEKSDKFLKELRGRKDRMHPQRSGSLSPIGLIAQADSAVTRLATGTFSLYKGSPGSFTDSGDNRDAVAFCSFEAGDDAMLIWQANPESGGYWAALACNDRSVGTVLCVNCEDPGDMPAKFDITITGATNTGSVQGSPLGIDLASFLNDTHTFLHQSACLHAAFIETGDSTDDTSAPPLPTPPAIGTPTRLYMFTNPTFLAGEYRLHLGIQFQFDDPVLGWTDYDVAWWWWYASTPATNKIECMDASLGFTNNPLSGATQQTFTLAFGGITYNV